MAEPNEFLRLENALFQAGREMQFPPTPALAARVRAGLVSARPENLAGHAGLFGGVRRAWLAIAVAVLLALALLFAIPATRDAVAQFLGLRGLRIFYLTPTPVPTSTPIATPTVIPPTSAATAGTGLNLTDTPTTTATATPTARPTATRKPIALCCEMSLEQAQQRSEFKLLVPPGELPSHVYYQDVYGNGTQVVMVFGDLAKPRYTLYQAQRWIYGKLLGKGVGGDTVIGEAQVRGERALWFSGGAHVVMILDAFGTPVFDSQRTVQGNTLVWETGTPDRGVIYRIETDATLQDTVKLTESLQAYKP